MPEDVDRGNQATWRSMLPRSLTLKGLSEPISVRVVRA